MGSVSILYVDVSAGQNVS
ncbi:hypothetical protein BsWGS_16616 [Bradybaena similaris]